MTTITKKRLYRGILFAVAALCFFEAVGEWAFTIPFRHYYFPSQVDRFEWLRVTCFLVAASLCFAEGYSLLIRRRFNPRRLTTRSSERRLAVGFFLQSTLDLASLRR